MCAQVLVWLLSDVVLCVQVLVWLLSDVVLCVQVLVWLPSGVVLCVQVLVWLLSEVVLCVRRCWCGCCLMSSTGILSTGILLRRVNNQRAFVDGQKRHGQNDDGHRS